MSFADLAGLVVFKPLERPLRADGTPVRSPFRASWGSTVELLSRELRELRAETCVLELDLAPEDFRLDGLPRANRAGWSPGVVLSFRSRKWNQSIRYEVSRYDDWQDNIRAIALALTALRAVDRYGVTKSGEQYRGWAQIGSGQGAGDGNAARGAELVRRAGGIKPALHAAHPDHGGEPDDFKDVIAYRDQQA